MNARLIAAALVALLAVSAGGCNDPKTVLKAKPKVITRKATVASPDASVEGTLSVTLPSDLALWPGANVVESSETEEAITLTLLASDEFDDVLAGLAKGMQDAGWSVAQEDSDTSEDGAGKVTILEIGNDTYEGFITLLENADGTVQIDYVVSRIAS